MPSVSVAVVTQSDGLFLSQRVIVTLAIGASPAPSSLTSSVTLPPMMAPSRVPVPFEGESGASNTGAAEVRATGTAETGAELPSVVVDAGLEIPSLVDKEGGTVEATIGAAVVGATVTGGAVIADGLVVTMDGHGSFTQVQT